MTPVTTPPKTNHHASSTQRPAPDIPGVSPGLPVNLALAGVPIPCPCQAILGDPESTCGLWIVTVDDFTTAHPTREVAEIVAQIAAALPTMFETPC